MQNIFIMTFYSLYQGYQFQFSHSDSIMKKKKNGCLYINNYKYIILCKYMIQLSIDKIIITWMSLQNSTKDLSLTLISSHASFSSTFKPFTLKYSTVLPNEIPLIKKRKKTTLSLKHTQNHIHTYIYIHICKQIKKSLKIKILKKKNLKNLI